MDEITKQSIEILKSIIQNPNTRIGYSSYSKKIEIALWDVDEKSREQYLRLDIGESIVKIRDELK